MKLACAAAAAVVATFGCGAASSPVTQVSATATGAPGVRPLMAITAGSVGPIQESTLANLTALRALLDKDGYAVRAVNNAGVEYHVFRAGELLLYVIPNDNGTLFNVHVVSGKIEISEHPEWRIGAAFENDALLTHCECWGTHPVCYRRGDHVAVAFDRACEGLDDPHARRALAGVPIQRAVWSPTTFGSDADDAAVEDEPPSVIPSGAKDPGGS